MNTKRLIVLVSGSLLTLPFVVSAAGDKPLFEIPDWHLKFEQIGATTLPELIIKTVNVAIPLTAILAIVLIMWGGFKRLTAAGDKEAAGEAGEIMWAALIGMCIAFGSYVGLAAINPHLLTLPPLKLDDIIDTKDARKVDVSGTPGESEMGTAYGTPEEGTPYTGPISPDFATLANRGLKFSNDNDSDGLPTGEINSTNRDVIAHGRGTVRLDPRIAAFYNAALNDPLLKNIPETTSLVGGHRYGNGGDGVSPHINGRGIDMANDREFVKWAYTNRVRLGLSQIITATFPEYNFGHNSDSGLLSDHRTHVHFSFQPS